MIDGYCKEQLPFFLRQMKNKYDEVAKAIPEVADIIPNYVGKWAKVNSINRDIPISDGKSTYMFDGDELVGDFSSAFLPFNASTAHVRIPITPDMRVKITDNKQVKEDTVFV